MKGIRFYLEYPDNKSKRKATRKNLGNHEGNVIALIEETARVGLFNEIDNDAIGAVYYYANSPCASTCVTWGYLTDKCKRISESQAKEIHPNLFAYLNQ